MKQELTIERLKFAREIGATHLSSGWMFIKEDGAGSWLFYNNAVSRWVETDINVYSHNKIDFTPLDEHEAAQEVPEGYYLDDESGKLKPKSESARSKYHREIKPGVWVDVYDVINAWGITNPAQQHLAKKALQAGDRGHKGYAEDMRDIIASSGRAIEINEGEAK